jgi:hypothetical protein
MIPCSCGSRVLLMLLKVPCMSSYRALQVSPQGVTAARQPFYVTFREHYCFSPSIPVPLPDEEAFKHGFLPPGCRFVEVQVSLRTINQNLLTQIRLALVGWSQHH